MSFSFKAVASGLGAIFGLGGVLLLIVGTTSNNSSAISSGWTLVALSVGMWLFSIILRKIG